jgi:hypothetical protein
MNELMLSYNLLFASTRASRRHFRIKERRRCRSKIGVTDPFLDRLCTERLCKLLPVDKAGRPRFSTSEDFPVFGTRLSAIQSFMLNHEPKSVWYLWKDGRSLEKITTFHAVIIFGTLGVIIAVIQTVLSGLQLHYAKLQVTQGSNWPRKNISTYILLRKFDVGNAIMLSSCLNCNYFWFQ